MVNVMAEEMVPQGSEELFDLLDKLPRRLSGFIYDGAHPTFDTHNKAWILQKKEHGKLIKMTVPYEWNDLMKKLKELKVDIAKIDLEHMEQLRKKSRDLRQPIISEELDQASWSVRVPFLLGQALYMKALQHLDLSMEERKDADLAVKKFLEYYEKLYAHDINKLSPDQMRRRQELERKADQLAKNCGYNVESRTFIQFVNVKYSCPNTASMPEKVPGAKHMDEVLLPELGWTPEREEQQIREDISMRIKNA